MNPLVAVTCTALPAEEDPSARRLSLYTTYVEVLEREGLAAVPLSAAHGAVSVEAILGRAGGLILSGGGDVDPGRYGEAPGPALEWVSEARDAMELAALDIALGRGMPVLAICRGIQVLNVLRGGTLFQDLPTERGGEVGHAQTGGWVARAHGVEIVPGTLLENAVGARRIQVNSFHHQGLRDVGRGLRIAATSADGLVEAVDDPAHRWLLGVQWHPERQGPDLPEGDADRRIFAAFRQAVLAYESAGAAG